MIYALQFKLTKEGPTLKAGELLERGPRFGPALRIRSMWPFILDGSVPNVPKAILHTTCGHMGELEFTYKEMTFLIEAAQKSLPLGSPALNAYLIAGCADERDWLSTEERRCRELDRYVALWIHFFWVEVG